MDTVSGFRRVERPDGDLGPIVSRDDEERDWDYAGGDAGTVVVPADRRVIGIAATSVAGGTLQINGGDLVPVPANADISVAPQGCLKGPTIVFENTDAYFVEHVEE